MDSPIHDCIDGDRDRDELTAQERRELAALEALIGAVAQPLRTAPVPDLSARVMARVAVIRGRPSRTDRLVAALWRPLDWLWTPRPLQLRPAYAVATVAALIAVAVILPPPGSQAHPYGIQAGAVVADAPQVYVQFRLEARGASRVTLAGSFTGWQPTYELRENEHGTWSILVPLRPGIHDYAFIVDGREWVADPHALHIDDGFGGVNSRIALPSALQS
jgi:hypothetical protein